MSELGQNLLTWVVFWLASSVFKYYCLPTITLFSNAVGLSYIGDFVLIAINYASELCISYQLYYMLGRIILYLSSLTLLSLRLSRALQSLSELMIVLF